MAARPIARFDRPFDCTLALPGSKSIALRQLLISSLADAPTRLRGVPRCGDVDAMLDALARLGCAVSRSDGSPDIAIAPPAAPAPDGIELDAGMSGVSLRLLLARAALGAGTTRFDGHAQLRRRPNGDLLDALAGLGCAVRSSGGRLPIAIAGPAAPARETVLRTGVTSQYLSALLLVAPKLPAGLAIRLRGARVSASYIGVTHAEMARRGAAVRMEDAETVFVPPGRYAGGTLRIEGDASAATYHAALATLHGSRITLSNLGEDTRQGDYAFLALCERIGARIERRPGSVRIAGPAALAALGTVDMADMPDAAPTLMALAPFLPAPTRLTGLSTLRVKECDRIDAGAAELRRAGVYVDVRGDDMTVHPARRVRPCAFETYEDHRMAMALSVFASKAGGCAILGSDCVAKTYPDYWRDFARLQP